MKKQIVSAKRLAWTSAALCVGCCAAIPVLGLLGVTVAAGLRIYFEIASIGLLIASLTLFGYYYLSLKKKPIVKKTISFPNCKCILGRN